MSEGTLLVRTPDVLERVFSDERLLASPSGGDVTSLQGTAVAIWDLLRTPGTSGGLVRKLAREFGVPEPTVETDVASLVDDLIDRGLVFEVNDADD